MVNDWYSYFCPTDTMPKDRKDSVTRNNASNQTMKFCPECRKAYQWYTNGIDHFPGIRGYGIDKEQWIYCGCKERTYVKPVEEVITDPELGDTISGLKLGKRYNKRHIYTECKECKAKRWTLLGNTKTKEYTGLCQTCLLSRPRPNRRKK